MRSVIKSIKPVEKNSGTASDVKRRQSSKNVDCACDIKLNVCNRIENVLINVMKISDFNLFSLDLLIHVNFFFVLYIYVY